MTLKPISNRAKSVHVLKRDKIFPLAIAIFLGYTKADETFIKVNLGGGPNG